MSILGSTTLPLQVLFHPLRNGKSVYLLEPMWEPEEIRCKRAEEVKAFCTSQPWWHEWESCTVRTQWQCCAGMSGLSHLREVINSGQGQLLALFWVLQNGFNPDILPLQGQQSCIGNLKKGTCPVEECVWGGEHRKFICMHLELLSQEDKVSVMVVEHRQEARGVLIFFPPLSSVCHQDVWKSQRG